MSTRGFFSRVRAGWPALVFGLSSSASATVPFGAPLDFEAPRSFRIDTYLDPQGGFHTVDLNEDGRLDLLYVLGDRILALFGDRRAGFVPAEAIPLANAVWLHDFVDVNADGHLDLVGSFGRSVRVLLGAGRGEFAAAVDSHTGLNQNGTARADFDGDGSLDLVVTGSGTRRTAGGCRTFTGDGNGGFARRAILVSDSATPSAVVGDFDENGSPDVFIVGPDQVFLGDGNGGHAYASDVVCDPGFASASAVDVDGDGHLDLLGTTRWTTAPSVVAVALGDGSGAFAPATRFEEIPATSPMTIADVDLDGRIDLVFEDSVHFGNGSADPRTFETLSFEVGPSRRDCPGILRWTGDFDQDGIGDLAFESGLEVLVALGDGERKFRLARWGPLAPGALAVPLAAADFDGDGRDDVAALPNDAPLSIFRSSPAGDPGDPVTVGVASGASDFATADFDLDGSTDVAVLRTNLVDVYFADGNGGFAAPHSLGVLGSRAIAVADFDANGLPDVAVANYGTTHGFEGAVSLRLAGPVGEFLPHAEFIAGAGPALLVPGDFDGDGRLDLAVGKDQGSGIFILFGDGAGSLAPSVSVDSVYRLAALDAGDGDGDGVLDLVVNGFHADIPSGRRVFFLRGLGTGEFASPELLSEAGDSPSRVALADFNRDGRLDVVAASAYEDSIHVVAGDGRGGFSAPARFSTCARTSLVVGDFDGNGAPDLALSNASAAVVQVALNRTFDAARARRGNVNAGVGPAADVLLVNGSPGAGPDRSIDLGMAEPFEIAMASPPRAGAAESPFALYGWTTGAVTVATMRHLPFDLGISCFPTPLTPDPEFEPRVVWNNIGRESGLGAPTQPSGPAPSVVLSRPGGIGRRLDLTLQGFIRDPGSLNGRTSLTNAVTVRVR